MRKIIVLCVLLGILLYGWSVDLQLSPLDKFNLAFPPNSEVKIAFEDIESLASSNNISPKLVRLQYEEKLAYRYHTCIKGLTLSRFDSLKKAKKLPINASCLEAMDNMLLQSLEMRRVSIRLTQPALRPVPALEKKILIDQPSDWLTATAAFSSKSSIAVLASEEGATNGTSSLISIDINAGRKIVKLASIHGVDIRNISLSPNGRIAAVSVQKPFSNNEVMFLDTETGNILGRVDQTIAVQVWLPEMSAALLKHNTNSTILMADFLTGKVSPYEVNSKEQRWGIVVSTSPSRILVGTDHAFYLVQNERNEYGIKSTALKEFYPKQNQYDSYKPPIVMLNGKAAVFNTGNSLVQYDLDTGKETQIETQPILDNQFEKLDEERVLAKLKNGNTSVVFNLKDLSISNIIENGGDSGVLSALNDRNGFKRIKRGQVWIGQSLETIQTQSLASLIAEKKAEEQVKHMLEKAQSEREIALFGMPVSEEPQPEMLRMPRRRNPDTGKVVQDAFGKPDTDSETTKVQFIKSNFLNTKIPTNTRYEFIGVKNATANEIQVTIQKSSRPLLLILSSCQTVRWKITKLQGSRLIGVFQQIKYAGQPFSSLNIDNTEYSTQQMTRISYCAFDKNSSEYKALEQEVLEKDGKKIEKFQGAESGLAFSVGN